MGNLAKKALMCSIILSLSLTSFTMPCFSQTLVSEMNDFTEFELNQINYYISDYFSLRNDVLKTSNLTEVLCDSNISDSSVISIDRINYNKNMWKI